MHVLQDVPGVQLYVATKTVMLNGVELLKYRCRRGSNSLEGLHSHLVNAIPSKRCGLMPFQVNFATNSFDVLIIKMLEKSFTEFLACSHFSFSWKEYFMSYNFNFKDLQVYLNSLLTGVS